MLARPNALQWAGARGHYEVYYVTLTDPATGVGFWIRYTMLSPLGSGGSPTCALWFLAMDPRPGKQKTYARKLTLPIAGLRAEAEPFRLNVGEAWLTDHGMAGALDDASWDLRWVPQDRHYEHVHPLLRRAGIAQTVLVLPHADLAIDGTISFSGNDIALDGARGGQAHLWGAKHAVSWAWAHCNDFETSQGAPAPGTFVDAVSVFVRRAGRTVGPSTPVVARVDGQDFSSTTPLRVVRNESTFALSGWRFEAIAGARKLIGEIDAERSLLAGVTYHDPDGETAYCYNGETATMRLAVYGRSRQVGGWRHQQTLVAPGRAHFEFAQRQAVPGIELLTQ